MCKWGEDGGTKCAIRNSNFADPLLRRKNWLVRPREILHITSILCASLILSKKLCYCRQFLMIPLGLSVSGGASLGSYFQRRYRWFE